MIIFKPSAYLWEDCATQLANMFLFHYVLMHDNLCMPKWFSDTVRYSDDLITLNNSNSEEEIPITCTYLTT